MFGQKYWLQYAFIYHGSRINKLMNFFLMFSCKMKNASRPKKYVLKGHPLCPMSIFTKCTAPGGMAWEEAR